MIIIAKWSAFCGINAITSIPEHTHTSPFSSDGESIFITREIFIREVDRVYCWGSIHHSKDFFRYVSWRNLNYLAMCSVEWTHLQMFSSCGLNSLYRKTGLTVEIAVCFCYFYLELKYGLLKVCLDFSNFSVALVCEV